MNWFSKLFKGEERSLENPNIPLSRFSEYFNFPAASETGITVTTAKALEVPAIWCAVNFLSDTIATLPLKLFERTDTGSVPVSGSDLYSILHDAPNPELTSFKWRKQMMTTTLTEGRSYSFIERSPAGFVLNIWPLDPANVTVKQEMGRTTYEVRQGSGGMVVFNADEIIDLPFILDSNGLDYYSPVYKLRNAIGLSIALEAYASKFFQSGGVPPLQLVGPFSSPASAERASFDVQEAVKAVRAKGGNVLPLPTGHELKPIGMDPSEGQMTEARRFQIEEVARIYGLPPVFIQDLSRATFNNVEQQALGLVKHTLSSWISVWEQELNLKLFGRGNRGQYVKFSVDGLLRGDFSTRMAGYATAITNGIRTPDEVRALEDLPPMGDNAEKLWIQGAMTPIDLPLVEGATIPLDSQGEGNDN